jgi:hypothetical protein
MLLFLGSWKSSLFQTPKEDISTEAKQGQEMTGKHFDGDRYLCRIWVLCRIQRTQNYHCDTENNG